MIRPATLALAPSLLIFLLAMGPNRDQVETRWEDSPPGERVASAIEEVRPPPAVVVVSIEPPAVVVRAVEYIPPKPIPLSITAPLAPDDIAALVAVYFSAAEVPTVLRVMRCESNFNPSAISPSGDRGLMQINRVHAQYNPATGTSLIGSLGYTWDDMLSPGPNLAVAAALVRRAGSWRDWSCA